MNLRFSQFPSFPLFLSSFFSFSYYLYGFEGRRKRIKMDYITIQTIHFFFRAGQSCWRRSARRLRWWFVLKDAVQWCSGWHCTVQLIVLQYYKEHAAFFLPTFVYSFLPLFPPSSHSSFPSTPTSPPPQATKLLKKSVKTNPSHAASWVALARIHQRTGQVLY
jgi:hypothetical protein